MIYIIRNYNRFLVDGNLDPYRGDRPPVYWDDFYIHRWKWLSKRLKKFNSIKEAEVFLVKNPELEENFDAWIVPFEESDWK